MSEVAIRNPHGARMRMLVLPREHGAWGILFVPLATGACLGLWQGGTPRLLLLLVIAIFAAVAAAALVGLLRSGDRRPLLFIGAAAAALFVAQGVVKKLGRKA